MKEINIIIEGFNVNGICVGCLNYNRRMAYDPDIKECFKLLGDIEASDGIDIQVCWECLAYVKNALRFRNQILTSYDLLYSYSQENSFLDSPNDFMYSAMTRLSQTAVSHVEQHTFKEKDEEKDTQVKEEAETEEFDFDPGAPIKEELPGLQDDIPFEDLPSVNDPSSDENVRLSLLKEKNRVKKRRKKKEMTAVSHVEHHTFEGQEKEKVPEVKEEASIEEFDFDLRAPIKKFQDDISFENLPSPVNDPSSDEDVKLSSLREKNKVKKRRKKKELVQNTTKQDQSTEKETQKKNRRLKNLPEDLVELYKLSEEDMLRVRTEDRVSKEFGKLRYKCDDCIIGFNTEKLRNDHMNGKHKKKGDICHQCTICQAYFLTKDNLACHRALHLNAYKCTVCGLKTTLKIRMIKHVAIHSAVQLHACETCGAEFSTKSKLSYHRAVCKQEKPQCDCCGKVFANIMTLKYHLKILPHNKEEKPKEKLFIPCKGCDKVFHSKKSYRAHAVIHDGLTYPCPICGKLFQWKRNLARHTRNHREKAAGELHECRACGKSFASRDCYNNHMRLSKRHVPEDAYQHECNYCGKKFATKWCLTDHIDWDHLKKIKYQCSVCFKAFKTAKIMVAHVSNIHEGKRKEAEGEHLCDICGKSYKTVKRLKGHVWAMHTKRSNAKSFKCKLCPATFTWQTSIYKHMKMMHDTNKKNKPSRAVPPVKKEEPHPGIELANRMQYFQQNIANNLNIVHIQPLGVAPNLV